MVDYPYGREGSAECFYNDRATLDELQDSAGIGDNDISVEEEVVYLYEAPQEDDPIRGHYSEWRVIDGDLYKKVDSVSGDDGMIHMMFEKESN